MPGEKTGERGSQKEDWATSGGLYQSLLSILMVTPRMQGETSCVQGLHSKLGSELSRRAALRRLRGSTDGRECSRIGPCCQTAIRCAQLYVSCIERGVGLAFLCAIADMPDSSV